jgi:hypothetical protein
LLLGGIVLKHIVTIAAALFAFSIPLSSIAQTTTYAHRHHVHVYQSDGTLRQFDTEEAAHRHCPSDIVVWLNTNSGIWHEKGMRWYGNTREGAYVCRQEAAAAGDRDTRNGQ